MKGGGVKEGVVKGRCDERGCGRHPSAQEADTPPIETATEAGSKHPTRMHSCS